MKHPELKAEKRTVLGKKVKKLRREGFLPGNVYGKGLESHALQIKLSDFENVYKNTGETGLVDLAFDGKSKPVLIKNLQMNHATRTLLHVDFYQVNLKEKVKTTVPVILTGEAKAVTDKIGLVLQSLSDVEIEALPDKLPEHIELSVEHLAEIGDQVTVADMKAPEDVIILTDPGQTVAKVMEQVVEEPESKEALEDEENAKDEALSGEEHAAEVSEQEKPTEEHKKE
ncbi:MAG TPA: 50S ribosomal protein L25 [Candidatus Sulfotelmatobacter sp.]|jgi:large subunit ribosomal protein L25|nr:50S ribosomal protein L25 [Candidatus Sulfotelmatobacter sp.]